MPVSFQKESSGFCPGEIEHKRQEILHHSGLSEEGPPKDIYILVRGTYEYVASYVKKKFAS
jgi:hypothetical protein